MATKKPNNVELLNAIRNDASGDYKEKVPVLKGMEDMPMLVDIYDTYPAIKNEFIQTLNAKIFKSMVMNKVWNNPLAMLKKGEIPYGQGIEQLFVDIATKKNFWEHFNGGSEADDLLKQEPSKVVAKFIQRNFQYKYKVSLSNERIRNAFSSATGVADLIDGQIASVMTAANHQEFRDMLELLIRDREDQNSPVGGTKLGTKSAGLLYRLKAHNGTSNPVSMLQMVAKGGVSSAAGVDPKDLSEKIRTYASELSFLSKEYNFAGVTTSTNPEDLVLFTTSDVIAKLDVHVLAEAFNVSKADVNVRVIKIPMNAFKKITGADYWGTNTNNKNNIRPVAILADKEIIQQYDTLIDSGSFYNPENLMTNMFVHRQGITAMCDFAQAVVFAVQEQ